MRFFPAGGAPVYVGPGGDGHGGVSACTAHTTAFLNAPPQPLFITLSTQVADIFTKALPKDAFLKFRAQLVTL
jgi:hypothetical protein